MSSPPSSPAPVFVTAVIVAHDGERWLPVLLEGLRASARTPDVVVAVDTASADSSRALLGDVAGLLLVDAAADSGFGEAVQSGLDRADATQPAPAESDSWVWLLHDDCAPAPDALDELLAVGSDPGVAVVGAKVRGWPRGRRLLEVGVTITGTGHRETGLEPAEQDQGQHDESRAVLAVSSAGMLVRRSVWDGVGGFDPHLPLFRDDVDFGWRVAGSGGTVTVAPRAVVFHAEAATRGVRAIANTASSPHRADRQAALYTLLVNANGAKLPWLYVRLCLGSLLRCLGYLLAKVPSAAYDELRAMLTVVAHPGRIRVGRRQRRSLAPRGPGRAQVLLAPWYTPYLNGVELLMAAVAGVRGTPPVSASADRLRAGRDDDAAGLEPDLDLADAVDSPPGAGPRAWLTRHPLLALTVLLAVAGLAASRGQWGSGLLQGGALLPAPDGAADWWRRYTESSHLVGLGTQLVTSPYVAMLAVVGSILGGKAWLVVDLVMLFAPVLAAVGGYVAARRLLTSVPVRVWAAATYALLPVLGGATTTGHVGSVVGLIVLPWLVRAAAPLLDRATEPTWRAVFASALALSTIVAFVPVAWPMAAALLLAGLPVLAARGQLPAAGHAALAIALPAYLLGPWAWRLLSHPDLFLTEAGIVDDATRPVANVAWQLPFGRLAAAGAAPWWLTAGVLIAAIAALLRRERRSAVAAAWLVAAVALGAAWAVSRQLVELPESSAQGFSWVGFPVAVAQGAAIVAAALAADGLFAHLRPGSFGYRQPIAALVAAGAVLAPTLGVVWWVAYAPNGELERSGFTDLPAYMADGIDAADGRALVVSGTSRATRYRLIAGPGLRLGDDSVLAGGEQAGLSGLVADALSVGTPDDANRLAGAGIRYVVLPAPAEPDFVAALDALPGLQRASTDTTELVGWQVTAKPTADPGLAAPVDGGVPGVLQRHRPWWLAAQAVLWLFSLAVAAPPFVAREPLTDVP